MKTPFCAQRDEIRWLDFLDGRLPASEARGFEEHLALCPECQAFCRQWRELETELEHSLPRPVLCEDFAARLRAKLATSSAAVPRPVTAQQRQQLETEFQSAWAEWRRQFLRAEIPVVLDGLGYGVLAALGGYFLLQFLITTVLQKLAQPSQSLTTVGVPLALGLGSVLLLGILWFTGRNQFARLLQAL